VLSLLKDKIAIVTGGSLGIGLAIMKELISQGAKVAIIARNADALKAAVDSIPSNLQSNVTSIAMDVTDEEQVKYAVAQVLEKFGRIDILVNSAGVSQKKSYPIAEIEFAEFKRIMNTNVDGVLLMTREVLKEMKKNDSGYIINILSNAAFNKASGGGAMYSASKYAARALTESLTADCKGSGIRVTSISPGPVNTNIWSHKAEPMPEEQKEKMLQGSNIASIVSFLLNMDENMFIDNITVEPWHYVKSKK